MVHTIDIGCAFIEFFVLEAIFCHHLGDPITLNKEVCVLGLEETGF